MFKKEKTKISELKKAMWLESYPFQVGIEEIPDTFIVEMYSYEIFKSPVQAIFYLLIHHPLYLFNEIRFLGIIRFYHSLKYRP